MQKYLLSLILIASAGAICRADELPNVILMMADDMGLGDTSAYQDVTGNSDADQIATPNMRRLARMGVRFTDAHTPSSRCSPTRYGLLTGRYPWRNRLKHFVLFGVQGDPMIEADRPTIGTLMQSHGYRTGLFGKWHVGLRYRQSDGRPAAAWEDADLSQPMADTPLDHGFDVCRFTSRSHGTSGLALGTKKKPNDENQSQGPGHIDGRDILSATGQGKQLHATGPNAYLLKELGGRHSDNAIEFVSEHLEGGKSASQPFFIYYPSNSNHTPHTPDEKIGEEWVAGRSMNVAGKPMSTREDFVYENDVALGRLINFLEMNEDPRRPGRKLIENTIVVFTSDNGAEKPAKTATGPFRSNKGSCYEGGHRVPFLVAWKLGGVGDGDPKTPGETNRSLICLTDMFATLSEVVGSDLPDLRAGEKGGEDSHSVLAAWRGDVLDARPMFYHDHKESKIDPAVCAMRLDDPTVNGQVIPGQWKILFDAALIRAGQTNPIELYELTSDPMESVNRVGDSGLKPLVQHLCKVAAIHRNSGGHRYSELAEPTSVTLDFKNDDELRALLLGSDKKEIVANAGDVSVKVSARSPKDADKLATFNLSPNGLGITGGILKKVDRGESIVIECDRDVIVESVSLFANGQPCGGFYRLGDKSPLAIYCTDADIDSRDQSGILSDIGILKAGEILELSSAPHLGVESPGNWRLVSIKLRGVAASNE